MRALCLGLMLAGLSGCEVDGLVLDEDIVQIGEAIQISEEGVTIGGELGVVVREDEVRIGGDAIQVSEDRVVVGGELGVVVSEKGVRIGGLLIPARPALRKSRLSAKASGAGLDSC